MARTTKKSVNFYKPEVSGDTSFLNLMLQKNVLETGEVDFDGMSLELLHYNDEGEYITGMFITTRTAGIPPKRDVPNNKFDKILLNVKEGLAYANAFLYSKNYDVLLLEFNVNGAYPSKIAQFFEQKLSNKFDIPKFTVGFDFVLQPDAYDKLAKYKIIKDCFIQVANPSKFAEQTIGKKDSIERLAKTGKESNSSSFNVHFKGDIDTGGVSRDFVNSMAKQVVAMGRGEEDRRTKNSMKITGLTVDPTDPEKSVEETIDLFVDRIKFKFKMDEPDILDGIQYVERHRGIVEAYNYKMSLLEVLLQNSVV